VADKCFIRGCRKYEGMKQVDFRGKKVMMCKTHQEAYKYAK
jgi:hypothetical protein